MSNSRAQNCDYRAGLLASGVDIASPLPVRGASWQRQRRCSAVVIAHGRALPYIQSAYIIPIVTTWDEAKRRRNFRDHGIDLADLEGFFEGDVLTREDTREAYGEVRYQSIGVFNGVALFVVWTPRGEQGDIPHLISARKAVKHERQAWSRRYRKRH